MSDALPLAVVGVLNTVWFAAAFRFFGFQQNNAAKVLVMRQHRQGPVYGSMAALVRFLGGMNGALALLSAIATVCWLLDTDQFASSSERGMLLGVMGVAHFTQFAFNVPVLKQRRASDDLLWPVTAGPMRRIFVIDFVLAVIDFVTVIALAAANF